MFDSLFNFISKLTNVMPSYDKNVCIAAKQSTAACHVCKDVCPHQAISLKRFVEIDDIDCTGCGLCVQSCPSQALEAKVSFQPGAPIKCSQVKGTAQGIQCLTRLSPMDLLKAAGTKNNVHLVRNDCANCKIGSEAVPEKLMQTIQKAKALAEFRNRSIDYQVTLAQKYDSTDNPDKISRRELLRGGFRNLQVTAAEALAPLDMLEDKDLHLPREMQRQLSLIHNAKPKPEQLVPWIVPEIKEGCIMCPVCTNACPTKAFSRDFSDKEASKLLLESDKCNGCNACVKACPVKVISLKEPVTYEELTRGKHVVFTKHSKKTEGGVSR
jgi:ferredoxin